MSDHDRLATWDAAYVLGALAPSERREFESHLATCDRCRDAVAELGGLPGILGRVDRDRAHALLVEEAAAPPVDLVDRILERRRRTRARRRTLVVAGIAAAAAVVATVSGVTLATAPSTEQVVFASNADIPLTADATLTSVGWGTRIDLDCRYSATAAAGGATWTYTMWVIGDDGSAEQVSSWNAAAGSTAHVSAATSLARDDIEALEIRSPAGDPLLTALVD